MPYLIYLITMSAISADVQIDYFKKLKRHGHVHDWGIIFQIWTAAIIGVVLTAYFLAIEAAQLARDFEGYWGDFWNYVDMLSILINTVVVGVIMTDVLHEQNTAMPLGAQRTLKAFGCFLGWIKMFYWMRLFDATAFYLNLIITTIADCGKFLIMVFLTIMAFANFFLVINYDTHKTSYENAFVSDMTGSAFFNAFVTSYFFCLGSFNYLDFTAGGVGAQSMIVWVMFLLGTFMNMIIFMNMLIAIMAKTFNDVTEESERNALIEKINVIQDFIWLMDVNELFEGKKYIIRAQPIASKDIDQESFAQVAKRLQDAFEHKIKTVTNETHNKIDALDTAVYSLSNSVSDIRRMLARVVHEQKRIGEEKKQKTFARLQGALKADVKKQLATSAKFNNLFDKQLT